MCLEADFAPSVPNPVNDQQRLARGELVCRFDGQLAVEDKVHLGVGEPLPLLLQLEEVLEDELALVGEDEEVVDLPEEHVVEVAELLVVPGLQDPVGEPLELLLGRDRERDLGLLHHLREPEAPGGRGLVPGVLVRIQGRFGLCGGCATHFRRSEFFGGADFPFLLFENWEKNLVCLLIFENYKRLKLPRIVIESF